MKKRTVEELRRLKRIMDKNPEIERDARKAAESGDPKAYYTLGKALYYSEKYEEAEKYFKAAEEGGYVPLLIELRDEQLWKGCTAKAEEYLRRAADLGHCPAQSEYGIKLYEMGCMVQAEEYLRKAADGGDNSAKLYLSSILFETDREEEAKRYLNGAEENPYWLIEKHFTEVYADTKAYVAIYLVHNKIKSGKASEYLCTLADRGNVYVQNDLGWILLQSEDSAATGEKYLRMAADNGSVDAQKSLAYYYDRTGRVAESIEYLRMAADNGHAVSQANLAYYYDRTGRSSEADIYYRQAAEGVSEYERLYLGCMLANMKRYDEAETIFLSLIDADDHYYSVKAAYFLSDLMKNTGRADEGEKYLSMARKSGVYEDDEELYESYEEIPSIRFTPFTAFGGKDTLTAWDKDKFDDF